MMIIGAVLAIIGFVVGIKILWIVGLILLVVGAIFFLAARLGGPNRTYAGRRYWY